MYVSRYNECMSLGIMYVCMSTYNVCRSVGIMSVCVGKVIFRDKSRDYC